MDGDANQVERIRRHREHWLYNLKAVHPFEKWIAFAEAVIAAGMPVVELGLRPVGGGRTAGCIDPCGQLSVFETAKVIRRSAAFVGIGSGPAHLANATGVPGVILLGNYRRYSRYMPYSGSYAAGATDEAIQWEGPAADVPVQQALRTLGRFVPEVRRPAGAERAHG
jgi:heptosyltransferase III